MKFYFIFIFFFLIFSCKNESKDSNQNTSPKVNSQQQDYLIYPQEYYFLIDDLQFNKEILTNNKVKTYTAALYTNNLLYKKIIHTLDPGIHEFEYIEISNQNKKMDTIKSIQKLTKNAYLKKLKLSNGKTVQETIEENISIEGNTKQIIHTLNTNKGIEYENEYFENNKLIKKTFSKVDGVEKYLYNSSGQLIQGEYRVANKGVIRSYTQQYTDTTIVRKYTKGSQDEMTYLYTQNGNLKSITWVMNKNSWVEISFIYDAKNLLQKRIIKSSNKHFINSETMYSYTFF